MKTRTYLGLLICGLLISNCSQEDNNLISEGNYSIITASIESAAKTRSTVTIQPHQTNFSYWKTAS